MTDLSQTNRTEIESNIKRLEDQINQINRKIEIEKDDFQKRIKALENRRMIHRDQLKRYNNELDRRKSMETLIPSVSDHALLRYLERVYGFDVEKIRKEILTPNVVTALKAGASTVKQDGINLVLKGNSVVTVLTPTKKNGKKYRHEIDEDENWSFIP